MKYLISILALCLAFALNAQSSGDKSAKKPCDCIHKDVRGNSIAYISNLSQKIRKGATHIEITKDCPQDGECEGDCEWKKTVNRIQTDSTGSIIRDSLGNPITKKVVTTGKGFCTRDFKKLGPKSASDPEPLQSEKVNETEMTGFIRLFPNPAEDVLIVELGSAESLGGSLEVYSLSGQLQRRLVLAAFKGKVRQRIDLQGIPAGMYVLRYFDGEDRVSLRFVID